MCSVSCVRKLVGILIVVAAGSSCPGLSLQMPSVFSDHMVLQRDMEVPVWGRAGPGASVTVVFAGQSKEVVADSEGRWVVRLDALNASKSPQAMTVVSAESLLEFSDVLIGEVWFCSGQSNMYRPIGGIPGVRDSMVEGAGAVLARPENPNIRLFCDDEHPLWNAMKWQTARSQTLELFSAVAYFFGDKLLNELDVPVGLIHISRGGTMIQAWTPEEYARQAPVTVKYMDLYKQSRPVIQAYNRAFKEYRENRKNGAERPEPLPPEIDTARTFANISGLYERLVSPLVPFAIRGIVWYQGESNASREGTARHYDDMLQALISGWRGVWNQPDLPVYFVQLPVWAKASQYWPWSRQSMLNVALRLPDVGMAVTVDVGDPDNLHPPKKQPVGERLAQLALARTYGQAVTASGPLPVSAIAERDALRVEFETFGSALQVEGGQWADLEAAGEDGVFYPAEGTVGVSDARVVCSQVETLAAVRYGWKGSFRPTLFDVEGLPASPFCFVRDGSGSWRLCDGDDCF